MLPGDRLVCAFVEPQAAGTAFTSWLLHVTIVPWFRLDDASERIAKGLQAALSPIAPFEAIAGEQVRFGPKHNRPANLVEAVQFSEIESRARHYFHKKRAWLVDETTKRKRQFRPHVTFQGDKHLHPGDTVRCDRLYIVEQRGSHKEVAAIIPLHEAGGHETAA